MVFLGDKSRTDRKGVMELARRSRMYANIVISVLAIVFAWLSFKDIHIVEVGGKVSGTLYIKSSLILIFFSWWYGLRFDINMQEFVYESVPGRGQFPFAGYPLALSVIVFFSLMCGFRNFVGLFLVFYLLFFVSNILGWTYITLFIASSIEKTRNNLREQPDALHRFFLDLVSSYMRGRWQIARFTFGSIGIALCLILHHIDIDSVVVSHMPGWSAEQFISFCVLLNTFILEAWMLFMRVKLKFSMDMLKDYERYCSESQQVAPS